MEIALGRLQRVLRPQRTNSVAGNHHEDDVVALLRWVRADAGFGRGALGIATRSRALPLSPHHDLHRVNLLPPGLIYRGSCKRQGSGPCADRRDLWIRETSRLQQGVLAHPRDKCNRYEAIRQGRGEIRISCVSNDSLTGFPAVLALPVV